MTEGFRLSPQQKRLWFLHQDNPAYRAQSARIDQLFEREGKTSFDFENGPLVRLALFCLSTNKHLFVVSLPALCADALTLKNFYDELCRTYDALLRGKDFHVEAMQYADF